MDDKKTERTVPAVELGGRTWFLKITHQVLERFSSISGCGLQDFDKMLQRYDMMTLLLWLMIAENRPDITRPMVRGWLQELPVFEAMQLVTQAVGDAVAYSFPDAAEAAAEAEPEAEEADEDPINPDV